MCSCFPPMGMSTKQSMESKIVRAAFVVIFCLVLMTTALHRVLLASQNQHAASNQHEPVSLKLPHNCDAWTTAAAQAYMCISLLTKNDGLWSRLHQIVDLCAQPLTKLIPTIPLYNKDDQKGYVPAIPNQTFSCQVVTLGIGGDILAEQTLKLYAPNCVFYGADPIFNSGMMYESLGKYYQVAVANESGVSMANVLRNPNDIFNYTRQSVNTLSLTDFFRLAQLDSTVDILFMDNEGAEYGLLPTLQERSLLEGYVVCQVSLELHGPIDQYGLKNGKQFDQLVRNFLQMSDFLPLWIMPPGNHQRWFLVNHRAQECMRRYFCSAS